MADRASASLARRTGAFASIAGLRLGLSVLPSRAVTTGLGLLTIAIADFRARDGLAFSEPVFWLGLLILLVPIAVALWSAEPTRSERIGLALLLGVGLWGVRLLYRPDGMIFYDEFSHWRTALDIQMTGRLFTPNPLQAISAYYPGLEALAATFASLSGLPLDVAGLLVILVGRVLLVLSLFVFFERAASSSRVAGIAVLIYVANPSFVYFDAQFSYESFAVGLAAFALATLALRERPSAGAPALVWPRALAILATVAIGATVVTHHLTSYGLVLFLIVWWAVARARREPAGSAAPPLPVVAFGAAATVGWLLLVASQTLDYLGPHIIGGVSQLLQLVEGESSGRALFVDTSGTVAPIWERVVGYLAVALILAGLPLGLRAIMRARHRTSLALALLLVSLVYPASLALRLTVAGAEASERLSAFVFVGIAFVIASWGVTIAVPAVRVAKRWAVTAASTIVFVGGVIVGFAPWARLPFAYRPAADSRSVEPESIAAASWTAQVLGDHHVFLADRTNRQLVGTYGDQDPVTTARGAVILLSPSLDAARRAIVALNVDYVLVDQRLSTVVPLVGNYVIGSELGGYQFSKPVPLANLTKFDNLKNASRIFDSGDIQIYDVRDVR